ncbi:50S ribosomal protein L3 N(5)-glutamine methyltransferase [Legionella dresdenensis]|uniref:50S ribosomal protein L3 N(5)-glutamine methyltransferase n=1 Tax=Legionella dresdenensis TaxID=450200 RepID=A0ABV8CCW9_9GAMM
MSFSYDDCTAKFETITDFIRFGISEANRHELWYGHGSDNSYDDIHALVLGTLALPNDINPSLLLSKLTEEEKDMLRHSLHQRIINRIPVPYLINRANFCGLSFYVDERVLIPRSPVAELIQQQFSHWIDPDKVRHVLDLCTGSGCIAIACSYAFPDAEIDAVDISPDALDVAAINCEEHGLEHDINLIESDCWENVPAIHYDIIISNPPYVGDVEMEELPEEYLHEPDLALRCEKNGLAVVEKILINAHHYLTDDGILVVEVGNSEQALIETYPDLPFTWLDFAHGGQGVFLLTCQQLKNYFER